MATLIDQTLKNVLQHIYAEIDNNGGEITVSSPKYNKTQIDKLVSKGLVIKVDASTLEGWEYILRPNNDGEKACLDDCNTLRCKVDEFLKRGEEIWHKEAQNTGGPFNVITVSGPLYDKWMGEIYIFNERHLLGHPLHDSIHNTYFHRNTKSSSYDDMMGHLRALEADDEFLGESDHKGENMTVTNSIADLLSEDIDRCKEFLDNPVDEAVGLDLYIDITGRYDSIIPNFGQGLYQYVEAQHFYDPEIDGETLVFNLKKLMNKMITYSAKNYSKNVFHVTRNREHEYGKNNSTKKMSNKVFIVHGHDNEAKQEMARVLEKAGFEAIILHEQADAGLTIIEKIEKYTDVDFAVVLYTECDLGRDKEAPVESERYRARQNVVFEHGYLMNKLGRNHVCAIVKGSVETPGDVSGVVYVPMDSNGGWKMQLCKNMKEAGLIVDIEKFCF